MAKLHKKPTKEELEEKQKEALEAAEKVEATPKEEETPEEVKDETPEVVDTPEEEGETEETAPPEPSEEEPVEEPEEAPEAEPSKELYKKKFEESSKEAQKIHAKNRVLNQALLDTDEIPEPTEEELQAEFKDWDMMSEVERTLAKETVISRNWRARIKEAQDQAKKIQKWNESVETFITGPQTLNDNPDLEGKEEDFKSFATEESNNSVPFNILVGAFLHEQTKVKKPNKGAMFPTGSGGPNDRIEPKSDILSVEEGRKLRETNYAMWREKLKAGKIAKE